MDLIIKNVVGDNGDLRGDIATPSPARERSPEWLRGSRFWLLQASDDEEEGGDVELSPEVEDSDMSIRYLCRTPTPVSGIDIVDDSRDLARRTLKRIEKRDAQRMATKASMVFASTEGMTSSSPLPLGKSLAKNKYMARPVMEPSIFMDDNDGGWTVVRQRHRPPVITGKVHDPKHVNISKSSEKSGMGLAGLRASPTKHLVHWNPSVARNRPSQRARPDGAHEPRQVRVGASIAGHAFRKLLGFSWRKKEQGEPVWRRRDLPSEMNGDGGRGVSIQGVELSTPAVEGFRVRPDTKDAATREEEGSRDVVASKGVATLLRAAGRGLLVEAIAPIKVPLKNLVWEVVQILCKEKVVAWVTSNAAPQPTHEIQENQGTGAKAKDNEGQGPQKKKKEEKSGCFRCKQPGHHIDDCPTPFCDLCESVHHATHACHLHQAPKPTTILHGYANEALMFFELACGAFKAKVENPRLAKVTVGDFQLKKIVPSDKFNWEVFHFKENVYRVKLPSKQEVQRLKNLGTYICNDRDSCLAFDIWSSLEEPMYTLPEVWVCVSGLPSDIRSDYLSLWGVGTLFGKTLDVDMAYTRRNKVLRTKIGCLDRSLIPKDSDMFIRRGFLKLFFEVEEAIGDQEVDMVEVNNGGDENDDAHNGEHTKEGGNAMDMDPKGQDDTNTSNNGGQDGAFISDGVQGMQLAQPLDEINIGSIKVPLSPTGISISGLPQVALGSATQSGSESARCQPGEQQLQPASVRTLPANGQRAGEPVVDTCERTTNTAAKAGSSVVADAAMDVGARVLSPQKSRLQGLAASGLSPLSATVGGTARLGSSTPVQPPLNAHAASWLQKIQPASAALAQADRANHWPIDGQSLGAQAAGFGGSSMHAAPVHGDD
ncbi:hypothetical protein ACQ4PT_051394 [Festuca glaucescens]